MELSWLDACAERVERTHLARYADSAILPKLTLREVDAGDRTEATGWSKPAGFWYEVDGDWRRWCQEEGFYRPDRQYHLYRVELGTTNVLRLTSVSEVEAFRSRFAQDPGWNEHINWRAVAAEYDGVEIAPYRWELRLDLTWYYTWDCASGVIWRPRGATAIYLGPWSWAPEEGAVDGS